MANDTQQGLFISYEGIERCGKSTQIGLLEQRCRLLTIPYVVAKEPGATAVGGAMRRLLKYPRESYIALDEAFPDNPDLPRMPIDQERGPESETLMFLTARSEFVNHIVAPALALGKLVVADRFRDSTRAYQGAGRFKDDPRALEDIDRFNDFVVQGHNPDITFFIDIPVQEMVRRTQANGLSNDYMERLGLDFFERVREGYHAIAKREPERIVTVNGAMRSPEVIFYNDILPAIAKRLPRIHSPFVP